VTPSHRGLLLVLAAALLWSLLGVLSQSLIEAGMGALEIAFWRAVIAGVAFSLHRMVGRRRAAAADVSPSTLLAVVAFALIGVTLFYASLSLAIEAGGISLAFILLYTAPVFVLLLAWPILGERPSARQWGLVSVAVTGVALVALAARGGAAGGGVGAAALAWGLTAGASYASYYLLGKWLLRSLPPAKLFAWMLPIGALGLWPWVSFTPDKTAAMWGALLLLGLLCTYLAYLLYSLGLQLLAANRAVLVATLEPVAAALWAALLFGERLGVAGWFGALLVVGAAALAALPAPVRPSPTAFSRGAREDR